MKRLGKMAVVCAVAIVWTGVAAQSPAYADGPTEKASQPATADTVVEDPLAIMVRELGATAVKNNEDLAVFRTWLNDLPGLDDSGFYEAEVDVASRTMTLLWKGASPLQAEIRQAAERSGITLIITAVDFSKTDVERAMVALADTDVSTEYGSLHVTTVMGPTLKSPQLTVGGYFLDKARATADVALPEVAASVRGVTEDVAPGLPVVVQPGSESVPFVTRSTDFAPLWAGGAMRGTNNMHCTSGFAIRYNNNYYTTTARHCNLTPFAAWDAPNSPYGTTVTTVNYALARVLTAMGAAKTFDGAWNNTAGYSKTVNAWADVSVGSYVCSSGANSGVHCNLQVDSMNASFNDGFGSAVPTIRVHQMTSGQIAGAQGDSGGPIFIPNSDGTHVWAVGMLQGSNETLTTTCGSMRLAVKYSAYIEFSSVHTLLNQLPGSSLVTAA